MSEQGRAAPELKPCPFCQQEVRAVVIKGAGYSLVGCGNLNCPASAIACDPNEWNIRAQPPTADAEHLAHELISEYFDRDDMGRLRTAIATALSAAKRQGRDEQRERDVRWCDNYAAGIESQNDVSGEVENFHDFHKGQQYGAMQIGAAIRSNQ